MRSAAAQRHAAAECRNSRLRAREGLFSRSSTMGSMSLPPISRPADASKRRIGWPVAERFLGVPYVWGGKTQAGLDCSGLVQTSLEAAGISAPRDTDMMEVALGHALQPEAGLRRGDLIFWKGHVGLMVDGETLLHANGFRDAGDREEPFAARARTYSDARKSSRPNDQAALKCGKRFAPIISRLEPVPQVRALPPAGPRRSSVLGRPLLPARPFTEVGCRSRCRRGRRLRERCVGLRAQEGR